jgi:hypothetical protein
MDPSRVARWYIIYTEEPTLGIFSRAKNEKYWYFLGPYGIFKGTLL